MWSFSLIVHREKSDGDTVAAADFFLVREN